MPPQNAISKLLDGLTKSEATYIAKKLRGNKSTLFLELLQKKNSSGIEVRSSFADMSAKAFATLRAKLTADITTLRGEYQVRNTPSEQVNQLRHRAEAYMRLGKITKAINTYFKAATLAASLEEFEAAAQQLSSILLMIDSEAPAAQKFVYAKSKYVRCGNEITRLLLLEADLERLKPLQEQERKIQALELLASLEGMPSPQTIKGRILDIRIKALCFAMCHKMKEAYALWESAHQIMIAHPYVLHSATMVCNLIPIHICLSSYLSGKGETSTATTILKTFLELLVEYGQVPTNLIQHELMRLEVTQAYEQGDFEAMDRLAEELHKAMRKGEFQNANRRLGIAVVLATKYLAIGNAKEALKWIERAYMDRRAEVMPESLAAAAIMELASIAMLEDWDRLDAAVGKAEYLFESRKQLNSYTRLVLRTFKEVVNDPEKVKAAFTKLRMDLEILKDEGDSKVIRTIFNLQQWVSHQLEQTGSLSHYQ